jgi:dTDP-4-amino-4,6-dideoxygalactose transaminase
MNSRLDAVQAALLRVKLRHLDAWNARRAELAALYDAGLARVGVRPPHRPEERETSHHQYTIRVARRDALRAFLAAEGIESAVHYPLAPFQQPVYAGRYDASVYPLGTAAAAEVLSLPLFAELDAGSVERVVAAVGRFGGEI